MKLSMLHIIVQKGLLSFTFPKPKHNPETLIEIFGFKLYGKLFLLFLEMPFMKF